MDQNENTKNGPEAGQSDIDDDVMMITEPVELPDKPKIEPARKCKLCGSPNHHACGCEARAMKEKTRITMPAAPAAPAAPDIDLEVDRVLSAEGIVDQHKAMIEMATDVKAAREFFEGCMSCLGDAVQYLKVIADDVITIRKRLTEEDKKEDV